MQTDYTTMETDSLSRHLYSCTNTTRLCPFLDIGERRGITGYIDFIRPNEFDYAAVIGTDMFHRRFITFRANVLFSNGTAIDTFTTVFQRYSHNDYLWMVAGRDRLLFHSDGGMNKAQYILLIKLFDELTIDVTDEMIRECRFYPIDVGIYPTKITMIGSNIKNANGVENVMP